MTIFAFFMTIFAGYMNTKKNWFSSREHGSRDLSDPNIVMVLGVVPAILLIFLNFVGFINWKNFYSCMIFKTLINLSRTLLFIYAILDLMGRTKKTSIKAL
jgi:hypothetical protein